VLQVRRLADENIRGRHRATGSSIAATGNSSQPAVGWPYRFRSTTTSRQPDVRVRRGVLSQLPVVPLPEAAPSRAALNRCGVTPSRRPSANVVTTNYGWIDSGDADNIEEESDKENHCVETGDLEFGIGDLEAGASQRPLSSCRDTFEVERTISVQS